MNRCRRGRLLLGRLAVPVAMALVAAGLTVSASSPAVATTPTVAQIAAGGETTCALMTTGNAYCWGDNTYGQFGNGTTTNSTTPQLVSGGYTWASIATMYDPYASDHVATACGITTSGAGYCWGGNSQGEVGDGTTTQRLTPTAISGGYTWSTISIGAAHVCGTTTSNATYCWGDNTYGELGTGDNTQRDTPSLVSGGYTWAQVSPGYYETCGVTTGHVGYCWGGDAWGDLGDPYGSDVNVPTSISFGYSWSQISVGQWTVCGVRTDGAGYCWGDDDGGQVGNGATVANYDTPQAVAGGHTWKTIAGSFASCGIATDDKTYCWGWDGSNENVPTEHDNGLTFSSISLGWGSANGTTICDLAPDGVVYCWGWNDESQVGDGTTTLQLSPVEVTSLFAVTDNTTLSVTVDPTFTFTVGNQSSVCNGESNFVSGAGATNAVALGHLAAGANVSGGQALSVAGNAGGGFAVYMRGTQATQNLRNAAHNWADVGGSYSTPAALGAGERFGFTYHDATASTSVTNPASANFVPLTNATTNAVMGSASSTSGSGCVSYDAQTSATTPAGSYAATVIYTAVPTF